MTFLIIVHILISIFLVCVILLQPGKADGGSGIGFGSSSQSIFGSRGAGNFLTKTTGVCAAIFLVTSFFLTRARIREFSGSVIRAEAKKAAPKAPEGAKPSTDKLSDAVKNAGKAPPPAADTPKGAIPPVEKVPPPGKAPLKSEEAPNKK